MDPYAQPTLDAALGAAEQIGGGEPCHRCGASPAQTNEYMWVISFVVFTRHLTYPAHLCRTCATRTGLTDLAKSALLGWWGVPWGLLTFGALYKNVRSLARWSSIPKPVLALAALLALSAPAAVVAYLVLDQRETAAAKATGDWWSEEVVELVERGHALANEGKPEAALASYLEAHRKAPGSSVINFSLATTYVALGRLDEALPYAARSEELAPRDAGSVALHGWLLARTGDEEGARARAARGASLEAKEGLDASWQTDLLYELEDWKALAGTAEAAAARFPGEPYFLTARMFALLGLDDLDTYGTVRAALPPAVLEQQDAQLADGVAALRRQPAERLPELLAAWSAGAVPPVIMRLSVAAVDRAGYGEPARERVRAYLHAAETPPDAWGLADAWLPEEALAAELDTYLARRAEPLPIWLRLASLDPLRDSGRRLELARRGRESDHPLAAPLDALYVRESRRRMAAAAWRLEMSEHLAQHPEHAGCRLFLAGERLEDDPPAARALLEDLGPADDPQIGPARELTRAEAYLAEGDLTGATAALEAAEAAPLGELGLADHARLLRMEIALHQGDDGALRRLADGFARSPDLEARAAALVLAWAGELAAGGRPSYRRDVDAWLSAADPAALRSSLSRSAQALLLLEGRTDEAAAALAMGAGGSPTLPWVRLLHEAAESGSVDDAALAAIAEAEPRYAWATRLARVVRQRRMGAGAGA